MESLGERNLAADGCMLVYSVLMKRTIKCLEERLEAYRWVMFRWNCHWTLDSVNSIFDSGCPELNVGRRVERRETKLAKLSWLAI